MPALHGKAREGMPTPRIVLGVGRIAPQKDISFLIDCLHAHAEYFRKSQVTFAWAGRLDDEDYGNQLKRKLADRNVADLWSWLGETDSIFDLYDQAAVFALTSIREGMPNVLLEAMSRGIPCVARPVADVSEILHDDPRYCCRGAPEDFAGALQAILELSNDQYAAASRDMIERAEPFSVQRMFCSYQALLT